MRILQYIKEMELETLATLLVASMFGWQNNDPIKEEEEEEEDIDPNDELIFQVIETKDLEQEYYYEQKRVYWEPDEYGIPVRKQTIDFIPSWVHNNSKYLTSSGNNPVLFPQATIADQERSACGFMPEEIKDKPGTEISEYYCWRHSGTGAKKRERRFHKWVAWIWRFKGNEEKLKIGWSKFWATYNIYKRRT